jgi:hypothetical protein
MSKTSFLRLTHVSRAACLLGLAFTLAGLAAIPSAKAEPPYYGGRHHAKQMQRIHEREWREHERRAAEWHRLHTVPAPHVVYAPPAVVVAPPAPPPSSGISLIIPLNFY